MNEVSSTAVRIGEQLESVHIERQRAQAAYDLIDFYNQFSRGDTTRLDALRKDGRAGRRQVAVLLRRLNTVAKEVDLPTGDTVRRQRSLLWGTKAVFRHEKTSRNTARSSKRKCWVSSTDATGEAIPR